MNNLWKANCSLASEDVVQCKDDEIVELKHQLTSRSTINNSTTNTHVEGNDPQICTWYNY